MLDYSNIDSYLEQQMDNSIAELSKLCAQPSVAAQNWGLTECADLVGQMLRHRGFRVEILPRLPGGGLPLVAPAG